MLKLGFGDEKITENKSKMSKTISTKPIGKI